MIKKAIVLTSSGFGLVLTKEQLDIVNQLAGNKYEIVSSEEFPCIEGIPTEHLDKLLEQYDGVVFMDISEQPELCDIDYKTPKQSIPFWANDWRKKHKR